MDTQELWLEEAQLRAQDLMDKAERSIDRDLSKHVAALGALMVFSGSVLMVFGVAFAFSLTVMVWGSVLAALAAVVRYKAQRARVQAMAIAQDAISELHALRLRQQAVHKLLSNGLPEGWSSADLSLVLQPSSGQRRSGSR